MKKNLLAATAFLIVSLAPALAVDITLSTFGSSVEPDIWTYNSGTSTVSGNDSAGALLYPSSFSPVNLTLVDANPANLAIAITGFVTTAPPGAFTISLEDGNISSLDSITTFSWSSFGTSSSTVTVSIGTLPVGFQWTNVVNWNLNAGGSGDPVNATFTKLAVTAVPEPSTYALLAISGVAFGGYVIRRRRRA